MVKKETKLKRRGNAMTTKSFKSLNVNMLHSKKSSIMSSKDSLKDISPINWSKDVLEGKKKILVDNK